VPSPFSGTAAALFWAAAGTAYCYVASVPMLTLHSTRRVLARTESWVNVCFCSVVAALFLAVLWDIFLVSCVGVLRVTGIIALLGVAGAQLLLLWQVLRAPDMTHDTRFSSKRGRQCGDSIPIVASQRSRR
jgi:hypothetical protein